MSKILIIDTSDNKKIRIELEVNGKKEVLISDSKNIRSQKTLLLIGKILKDKKIAVNTLSEIKVNKGPGSFTGLRVGVSIANTISFFLKIPINGKPIGYLEEPVYN